jgi:hypothetical protein
VAQGPQVHACVLRLQIPEDLYLLVKHELAWWFHLSRLQITAISLCPQLLMGFFIPLVLKLLDLSFVLFELTLLRHMEGIVGPSSVDVGTYFVKNL